MNGGASDPRNDHLPVVPAWTCETCGGEWPCAPKQRRLLEEYRGERPALAVYLGSCLAAATQDLRGVPERILQRRFTGWLPRQSRSW
ncbi:hypothetical protein ACGFJ5_01400 [Micromonospora echinaurantiaca]|uniref:hypothetical protein n=1 Tax=Micromonospora echinaurantiaca TaxID=47857 RepID=UPI003722A868